MQPDETSRQLGGQALATVPCAREGCAAAIGVQGFGYIYDMLLKDKLEKLESEGYVLISLPNEMKTIEGFAPSGRSKHCFVASIFREQAPVHELGHCIGLDHIAVDLGECNDGTIRSNLSSCKSQTSTYNAMGYKDKAIDFFIWQCEKILTLISNKK